MGYQPRHALVRVVRRLSWTTRVLSLVGAVILAGLGGIAAAGTAGASTSGCTSLGAECGTNVNVFGNAFDVRHQAATVNNLVISYPNSTTDPATDFHRTGAGPWYYEYAPNGHGSGLCISDPEGGYAADPGGPDGLVLRTCNNSKFQGFKDSTVTGPGGHQLVNLASGKPVQTNGTGAQLTDGGNYTGGSYWTWKGGTDTVTPPPPPTSWTAKTTITNDPDSGDHGTWATDTITRTVTIYAHGAVANTDCSATATSCFYFTGKLSDAGTFTAANGAPSPKAGTPIQGPVSGSISGSANYAFFSTSDSPSSASVPATHDDANAAGVAPFTSGHWYELFFPSGTGFAGTGLVDNWTWTYTTTSACVSPAQVWVDAASNGAGVSSAGDITGDASC